MSRGILITGTDTGVGKTTVACGIAAALRRRGVRIGVLKPAETGCPSRDGALAAEDAERLRHFSESQKPDDVCCPYRFAEPLAPAVAARRAGEAIDIQILKQCYAAVAADCDLTLVEGAGGLLVPLTAALTFADLARALELPLLLVVGNRLGAINHALLTMESARSRGLQVLGYVINSLSPHSDLACDTNSEELQRWLGPPLGHVPFLGAVGLEPTERLRLAEVFETAVHLDELTGATV